MTFVSFISSGASFLQKPQFGSSKVSSHYGERVHPKTGVRKVHAGTDFACSVGTPAKAAEAGAIARSGFDIGGGNYVVIAGSSGREFKYLYLSRLDASAARMQPPAAVQVIAYTGNTGNTGAWTTGPHLHFEVWPSKAQSTNGEPLMCGGVDMAPGILDGEDLTGLPSAPAIAGGPGPSSPLVSTAAWKASWPTSSRHEP